MAITHTVSPAASFSEFDVMRTKVAYDRTKEILFQMWRLVECGTYDARSPIGDQILSLRDAIFSECGCGTFDIEYKQWCQEQSNME
jgi:hypothetical protein